MERLLDTVDLVSGHDLLAAVAQRGLRKWKGRIRDEVYLIGERLHNFGESRPPPPPPPVADTAVTGDQSVELVAHG